MTYVITRSCCSDAACVPTCPVNCIHPVPGEPDFGISDMLYIDPDICIECSACVQVCPVAAIGHADDLPDESLPFIELNAAYYRQRSGDLPEPATPTRHAPAHGLRVAIVGSGPSGSYAANELLGVAGVEVNIFERLLTPQGLIRYGVAPDHPTTKSVTATLPYERTRERLNVHLGVEVGKDISHEELLAYHHAVIYAVGAPGDRPIGIPGEHLAGSIAAADFVAWYNGHPDAAHLSFDFSAGRVIVVGNGNVALDIARVLTAPVGSLERTDIADHALEALRNSQIQEVCVVGRRGPDNAAFSVSELIELTTRDDLTVTVEPAEVHGTAFAGEYARGMSAIRDLKVDRIVAIGDAPVGKAARQRKRITLRFGLTPLEVLGTDRVSGLKLKRTRAANAEDEEVVELEAGMVIRSVGFFGRPVPGVPFDSTTGTIPNDRGRVRDSAGAYVTGWIRRGPKGVIGTNKTCAAETVDSLLADYASGILPNPPHDVAKLLDLLRERRQTFDLQAWHAIDNAERAAGAAAGRPRVKITDQQQLANLANGTVLAKAPK